jgi:hypothetical protein
LKLKEFRKQNEEELKILQEEYEEKLGQASNIHEEEISYIRGQLNQVREEREKVVGKVMVIFRVFRSSDQKHSVGKAEVAEQLK